MASLEPAEKGLWTSPLPRAKGRKYRLCENYTSHAVCNWAVPAEDPNGLCPSCRLTRVIPDLTQPANLELWHKLEIAKRRLVYTLLILKLPLLNKTEDPENGLAFEFLDDPKDPKAPKVLTGHADGLITINIAEANDAEREKRKHDMHEPYRTLLGHFRHEVGHYYWDRLLKGSDRLDEFRALFGDDREDYGEALKRHYAKGPSPDWQKRFVTSYASSHAWEDWAETWAHYLHMIDTLETAATCGVSLRPRREGDPSVKAVPNPHKAEPFDELIDGWFPLTYLLNNLNRGLGLPDGYPFVLSEPAIEKLRFVHETVNGKVK